MSGDPRYRYYLTVILSGIEEDPSGKGYVGLDVEVASDGFYGASGCDLPIADLKSFAGDLVALADSRSTGASLIAGWGTAAAVELRFSPTGSRGHIQISVVLTEEDGQSASVSCTFSSEPQALHRFADALVRALSSKGTARLPLYVEGGPAV